METHEPFERDGKLYLPWFWLRNEGLLVWRDAYGPKEIAMMLFDNQHRCPLIERFSHVAVKDIMVDKWIGPQGGLRGYVVSVREGSDRR